MQVTRLIRLLIVTHDLAYTVLINIRSIAVPFRIRIPLGIPIFFHTHLSHAQSSLPCHPHAASDQPHGLQPTDALLVNPGRMTSTLPLPHNLPDMKHANAIDSYSCDGMINALQEVL